MSLQIVEYRLCNQNIFVYFYLQNIPHLNLGELIPLLVDRDHDLIDDSRFRGSKESGGVLFRESLVGRVQFVVIFRHRQSFAQNDVIAGDTSAGRNETVLVQFIVDGVTHTRHLIQGRKRVRGCVCVRVCVSCVCV